MENWYDQEQLVCVSCGHRWMLISDKTITNMQHKIWIKAVMKHHEQIKKEEE